MAGSDESDIGRICINSQCPRASEARLSYFVSIVGWVVSGYIEGDINE